MTATTIPAPAPPVATRPATPPATTPRFVLLGGVPGAGKTTAMEQLGAGQRRLDPEQVRRRLAERLPGWLPYRAYRAVVHVLATVQLVVLLLRGAGGGAVVVHDPATRPRRRALVGRLARARGWDPVLVVVDVGRAEALAGQEARGRVLRRAAFDRHWRRWRVQRPLLLEAASRGLPVGPWSRVLVADRVTAPAVLSAVSSGQ